MCGDDRTIGLEPDLSTVFRSLEGLDQRSALEHLRGLDRRSASRSSEGFHRPQEDDDVESLESNMGDVLANLQRQEQKPDDTKVSTVDDSEGEDFIEDTSEFSTFSSSGDNHGEGQSSHAPVANHGAADGLSTDDLSLVDNSASAAAVEVDNYQSRYHSRCLVVYSRMGYKSAEEINSMRPLHDAVAPNRNVAFGTLLHQESDTTIGRATNSVLPFDTSGNDAGISTSGAEMSVVDSDDSTAVSSIAGAALKDQDATTIGEDRNQEVVATTNQRLLVPSSPSTNGLVGIAATSSFNALQTPQVAPRLLQHAGDNQSSKGPRPLVSDEQQATRKLKDRAIGLHDDVASDKQQAGVVGLGFTAAAAALVGRAAAVVAPFFGLAVEPVATTKNPATPHQLAKQLEATKELLAKSESKNANISKESATVKKKNQELEVTVRYTDAKRKAERQKRKAERQKRMEERKKRKQVQKRKVEEMLERETPPRKRARVKRHYSYEY